MMNARRPILPLLLRTVGLLLWAGAFVLLLATGISYTWKGTVQQVLVTIDSTGGIHFVQSDDVAEMLEDYQLLSADAIHMPHVPLAPLEKAIQKIPWVASCRVYVTTNKCLCIDIKQRLPIIRIMHTDDVGYYLDETGKPFPLNPKFTARVPVLLLEDKKWFDDSLFKYEVFLLAKHIYSDSLLHALVDAVHVVHPKQIDLMIPLYGHRIRLGAPATGVERLDDLKQLYRLWGQSGQAYTYSVIDLRFRNRIFCTRRVSHYAPPLRSEKTVSARMSAAQFPVNTQ